MTLVFGENKQIEAHMAILIALLGTLGSKSRWNYNCEVGGDVCCATVEVKSYVKALHVNVVKDRDRERGCTQAMETYEGQTQQGGVDWRYKH